MAAGLVTAQPELRSRSLTLANGWGAESTLSGWWRGLLVEVVERNGRLEGQGSAAPAEVERAGAELVDRSGAFVVDLSEAVHDLLGVRARVVTRHPSGVTIPSAEIAEHVPGMPHVFSSSIDTADLRGHAAPVEVVARHGREALVRGTRPAPAGSILLDRLGNWAWWVQGSDLEIGTTVTTSWFGAVPSPTPVGSWAEIDGGAYPLAEDHSSEPLAALDPSFPEVPRSASASQRPGLPIAVPRTAVQRTFERRVRASVAGVHVEVERSLWPWSTSGIRVRSADPLPERAPDGFPFRSPGSDPTTAFVRWVDLRDVEGSAASTDVATSPERPLAVVCSRMLARDVIDTEVDR
jgi:hypothetical protein